MSETPFPCLACSHVLDFGPHVQTSVGMLAVGVKHDKGKPFCVNCEHVGLRTKVLEIARAA